MARIFVLQRDEKNVATFRNLNLLLWEEKPEVKGENKNEGQTEMTLWETGIPRRSVPEAQ